MDVVGNIVFGMKEKYQKNMIYDDNMSDTTGIDVNDTTFKTNDYYPYRLKMTVSKIPKHLKFIVDIKNEKRKELYHKFNTKYSGHI